MDYAKFDLTNEEIVQNFLGVSVAKGQSKSLPNLPSKIFKWAEPLRVLLYGDDANHYRPFVETRVAYIQHLSGHEIKTVSARAHVLVLFVRSFAEVLGKYRETARLWFSRDEEIESSIRNSNNRIFANVSVSASDALGRGIIIVDVNIGVEAVLSGLVMALNLIMGFKFTQGITDTCISQPHFFLDYTDQDKIFFKLLYDHRIRSGMEETEVEALARTIVAEIRSEQRTDTRTEG